MSLTDDMTGLSTKLFIGLRDVSAPRRLGSERKRHLRDGKSLVSASEAGQANFKARERIRELSVASDAESLTLIYRFSPVAVGLPGTSCKYRPP